MHFGRRILVAVWLFCLVIPTEAVAQKNAKTKYRSRANPGTGRDNRALPGQGQFDFPNLNRIAYYRDGKLLSQIIGYEHDKQWEKAYPLLTEYVRNFGTDNFSRDTHLLWRLAKLAELLDEPEKAKLLYRLVLKHTRDDVKRIKQIEYHYDSLSRNDGDAYVPIEYYYELVEYRKSIDTLRPPVGVLLNMGGEINSAAEDYGPTLSLDNDLLLFTSKRNRRKAVDRTTYNEDIYFSRRVDGYWEPAQALKKINTPYNEGSARITRNGKKLYFSRCQSPDSYGNCDIFVADLQPDSTWGGVRNLGPQVNGTSWDSHPALSHGEDTLFFASDRIGGFGMADLYFTYQKADGTWAPAQNLGPSVNTRQNEVSPFYHPVYDVLYFSSSGQLVGFGDFDIYKCHRRQGQWSEPKNIGPLVNGKGSEYYFTIDSQSKDLYYARSEESDLKNLDLQSFPLPMEAQPLAATRFGGSVRDSITGNPFTGIVSVIDLDEAIEVAPKYLRPDGSYDFDLIKDHRYLLIITGEDFFRIERSFVLRGDTAINIETPALSLQKWAFASVEFAENSAELHREMHADLNKVVDFMLDHPTFELKISGHTDSDGDAASNLRLSQKRAESIKKYLSAKGGVAADRVEAVGYGNKIPIIKQETTEEDKKINRRVEFEISRRKQN
ncbi:MAG: OmpA family protein [Ferruginibacter sp.]|nr:OmpA family protein [Cytophagales bacterium]